MRRRVRALPVMLIGVFALVATSTSMASAPALTGSGANVVAPAHAPATKTHAATVASPGTKRAANTPAPRDQSGILRVEPVGAAASSVSSRVSVKLDPGASAQRSFIVTNRSSTLRLTLAIGAVDATAGTDGDVNYSSTASLDGPASWVTFSDLVETLEPGTSARVTATVAPPADSLPGPVLAGLVVRVDQAAHADNGSSVSAHASVSIPIAIDVNGALTALVSITHVAAVKDHDHEFLALTFQNAGATANSMVGEAQVHGAGGRTYAIHASVAPLKRTTVQIPFEMPKGAKTASVSVATEDSAGDQASWNGRVGFTSSSAPPSATGVTTGATKSSGGTSPGSILSKAESLPRSALILVGVAFAVAALWFGAELRRNRSRRSGVMVPAVAGAVATYAFGTADPLGAVVSQLGALVEAIDRLVSGLGSAPAPVVTAAAPGTPEMVTPAPAAAGPRVVPDAPASEPAVVPVPASPTASVAPVVEAAIVPAPPAPEPVVVPEPEVAAPATEAPMSAAAEMAQLARLISLPSAPTVPEFDENDPYDWPTQAQLDQFAQRKREAQPNPE